MTNEELAALCEPIISRILQQLLAAGGRTVRDLDKDGLFRLAFVYGITFGRLTATGGG